MQLTTRTNQRLGRAFEIHVRAKQIIQLYRFLGIERFDSYFGIMSFSLVLSDIFSKDTKFTNHVTDCVHFRCCFDFGENNRSAVKYSTGW